MCVHLLSLGIGPAEYTHVGGVVLYLTVKCFCRFFCPAVVSVVTRKREQESAKRLYPVPAVHNHAALNMFRSAELNLGSPFITNM